MPYYNHISKQWHKATGYEGGPFKALVLNEVILSKIPRIEGCSILELGAGNGYFLPLVFRRFSGQRPSTVVITDQSPKLLEIAQKHFKAPGATYNVLDVRHPFPFGDSRFDLILALMIFNEVPSSVLCNALRECFRLLGARGTMVVAVSHPEFVENLRRRGELQRTRSIFTMPGTGSLRLPVVVRSAEKYRQTLTQAGFEYTEEEVRATPEVLNEKPGLQRVGREPLALVYKCVKG